MFAGLEDWVVSTHANIHLCDMWIGHSWSVSPRRALASHANVARLATRVLLGVDGGQTHELMAADLGHGAAGQLYRLRVDNLQDDILRVTEHHAPVFTAHTGQEAVVGGVQLGQPLTAVDVSG